MDWIAKTEPPRSLKDHTEDVLARWEELRQLFPELMDEKDWELLRIAAAVHDLGKVNTRFQNLLRVIAGLPELPVDGLDDTYHRAGVIQIPHGLLSLAFIDWSELVNRFTEDDLKLLMRVVARHHLRDFVQEDVVSEVIEKDPSLRRAEFLFLEGVPVCEPNDAFLGESELLKRIDDMHDDGHWHRWVLLKGLLNRLDYSASASLPIEDPPPPGCGLADCMNRFFWSRNLRPVQRYMKDASGRNVVVVASTGVGKTEAALLWIGDRKGFYTLPVRTAINAMYDRISKRPNEERKNALGYDSVALLHGDAMQVLFIDISGECETQNEAARQAQSQYERAKLLSAPLTISTVDQLFKFVFRYEGCEMILATLAGSSVVLDEIQMYPPPILAYLIEGLRHISEMGGRFAIVTATFPPLLGQIMRENGIEFEQPSRPFLSEPSVRHRIAFIRDPEFDWDEIALHARTKKVLVIVNTVRRAQEVFDNLEERHVSVRLLHSRFIRKHRAMLEKAIVDFTNDSDQGEPGVWVTTQVVEASLDVDFDLLYTEMCTAEGLLQRMGRVWRRRPFAYDGPPNVYILNNRSGGSGVVDPELYRFALQSFARRDGLFLPEYEKMTIIDEIYSPSTNPEILASKYYREIRRRLQALQVPPGRLTRKDADELFRDISSMTVIPEPVYRQLEDEGRVDHLCSILTDRSRRPAERMQARLELLKWTTDVPRHGQWIKNADQVEAFYVGSGVRRCRMGYSFVEEELRGKGLIGEASEDDTVLGG